MIVRVRLFAGLRERAGWAQREIDVSSVAEVWPALELGDEPADAEEARAGDLTSAAAPGP